MFSRRRISGGVHREQLTHAGATDHGFFAAGPAVRISHPLSDWLELAVDSSLDVELVGAGRQGQIAGRVGVDLSYRWASQVLAGGD